MILLDVLQQVRALPKAELHLHLEGAIAPETARELAARHGVRVTSEEVRARYQYSDFQGFLEAFKWVTSFLNAPEDYRLIAERLCEELRAQNVVYAEITQSTGVSLWRKQDPFANFAAVQDVAARERRRGLHIQWIFDATRQFGAGPAMEVARIAAQVKAAGVVAFGMGGDELSLPAAEFREVYDYAAEQGLRRLAHAGEVGGPEQIRDAIEILGAERIGHGIGAMHDPALQRLLAERKIPLEVCPTSNLCTGALAKQLGRAEAEIQEHPLAALYRRKIPVVLSTDDPAMFHTTIAEEYQAAATQMGLSACELYDLAEMSFAYAFLPVEEKSELLGKFRAAKVSLGLV
jgi:adenosine deaminase/aminodeoxyfutalosine deaminase